MDGTQSERLVVVQGIDDCIISESQGALLICKRDQEQRIREFMSEISLRFEKKFD